MRSGGRMPSLANAVAARDAALAQFDHADPQNALAVDAATLRLRAAELDLSIAVRDAKRVS